VTGQGSEFGGAHRFEKPIDACELAPGLENTPQRRVSLESNGRNFLFLTRELVLSRYGDILVIRGSVSRAQVRTAVAQALEIA
jgi:hypothetical protein